MHSIMSHLRRDTIDWPKLSIVIIGDKSIEDIPGALNPTFHCQNNCKLHEAIPSTYKYLDRNVDVLVVSGLTFEYLEAQTHADAPEAMKYYTFKERCTQEYYVKLMKDHTDVWLKLYPKLIVYWLLPYPPDLFRYYKQTLEHAHVRWNTDQQLILKFANMGKKFYAAIKKLKSLSSNANLPFIDLNECFFQHNDFERTFDENMHIATKWPGFFTNNGIDCSQLFATEFNDMFKDKLREKSVLINSILAKKPVDTAPKQLAMTSRILNGSHSSRQRPSDDPQVPCASKTHAHHSLSESAPISKKQLSGSFAAAASASSTFPSHYPLQSSLLAKTQTEFDVKEALALLKETTSTKKDATSLHSSFHWKYESYNFSEHFAKLYKPSWIDIFIKGDKTALTACIEFALQGFQSIKTGIGVKILAIVDTESKIDDSESHFSSNVANGEIGLNDDIKDGLPIILLDLPVNLRLRMVQKSYRDLSNLDIIIIFGDSLCKKHSSHHFEFTTLIKQIYKKKPPCEVQIVVISESGSAECEINAAKEVFRRKYITLLPGTESLKRDPDNYRDIAKSVSGVIPIKMQSDPSVTGHNTSSDLESRKVGRVVENERNIGSSLTTAFREIHEEQNVSSSGISSQSSHLRHSLALYSPTKALEEDSDSFETFLKLAGSDIEKKYRVEKQDLETDLQANYSAYIEIPDIHPLFDQKYAEFLSRFQLEFGPNYNLADSPIWVSFWKSSMQELLGKERISNFVELQERYRKRYDSFVNNSRKTTIPISTKQTSSQDNAMKSTETVAIEKTARPSFHLNDHQIHKNEFKPEFKGFVKSKSNANIFIKSVAGVIEYEKGSSIEDRSSQKPKKRMSMSEMLENETKSENHHVSISHIDKKKHKPESASEKLRDGTKIEKKYADITTESVLDRKKSEADSENKTKKYLNTGKQKSKNTERLGMEDFLNIYLRDKPERKQNDEHDKRKAPIEHGLRKKLKMELSPDKSSVNDYTLGKVHDNILPSSSRTDGSNVFSIPGTTRLLESICPDIGTIGFALAAVIKEVKSKDSKKTLDYFNDDENKVIINMVVNKLQKMIEDPVNGEKYKKTIAWANKLIAQAEKYGNLMKNKSVVSESKAVEAPTTSESSGFVDIDAIARATFGTDMKSTHQFIQNTFIYKGLASPSESDLQKLIKDVSKIHFSMAMD